MENIYALKGSKTMIIATHKIHTLKKCDKVFLIDSGKIQQIKNISEFSNSDDNIKKYSVNKN